jgi:hypothetical protein
MNQHLLDKMRQLDVNGLLPGINASSA